MFFARVPRRRLDRHLDRRTARILKRTSGLRFALHFVPHSIPQSLQLGCARNDQVRPWSIVTTQR
jgi:hypothetical protein